MVLKLAVLFQARKVRCPRTVCRHMEWKATVHTARWVDPRHPATARCSSMVTIVRPGSGLRLPNCQPAVRRHLSNRRPSGTSRNHPEASRRSHSRQTWSLVRCRRPSRRAPPKGLSSPGTRSMIGRVVAAVVDQAPFRPN